jgi:hypothetical protein
VYNKFMVENMNKKDSNNEKKEEAKGNSGPELLELEVLIQKQRESD